MSEGDKETHRVLFEKIEEIQKTSGRLENSNTGILKDVSHQKDSIEKVISRLESIEKAYLKKEDLNRVVKDVDDMEKDQKEFITVKGTQVLISLAGLLVGGVAILVSWLLGSTGK